VDEGIFLSYSIKSKAYKCYNKRLRKIVENVDVKIDELRVPTKGKDEIFLDYIKVNEVEEQPKN